MLNSQLKKAETSRKTYEVATEKLLQFAEVSEIVHIKISIDDDNLQSVEQTFFLPPANELWGKVMFLHMSVILTTEGLCIVSLPVWLPGPMFLPGGSRGGGFSVQDVSVLGVSLQGRGSPSGRLPTQYGEDRYTSYRNAFLFKCKFN